MIREVNVQSYKIIFSGTFIIRGKAVKEATSMQNFSGSSLTDRNLNLKTLVLGMVYYWKRLIIYDPT